MKIGNQTEMPCQITFFMAMSYNTGVDVANVYESPHLFQKNRSFSSGSPGIFLSRQGIGFAVEGLSGC